MFALKKFKQGKQNNYNKNRKLVKQNIRTDNDKGKIKMFGFLKKKENKKVQELTEDIKLEKFKTYIFDLERKILRDSLTSIMNANVKVKDENGKEVTDMRATISAMKTQARVALETVDNMKNKLEEKQAKK